MGGSSSRRRVIPTLSIARGRDDARVAPLVETSPVALAFLVWSRMPVATVDARGRLILSDQRFGNRLSRGQFQVIVDPKPEPRP